MSREIRWIAEIGMTLVMIAIGCLIVAGFVTLLRQEDICWDNGYALPVNYNGTVYCLGKDGRPETVPLAELVATQGRH